MSLPVISVQQMRDWERATWAAGQTVSAVIQRVGKIIATRVLQLTQTDDKILILGGKGHNGDDARAAIRHLSRRKVDVIEARDANIALKKISLHCRHEKPALIVDGLFGIGLNRPLNSDWRKLIAAINALKVPALAVDVPSGLDADTGEICGDSIRASLTLTLGAPKRGLLAANAVPFVGRLEAAKEIGLIPCPFSSDLNWTCAEDFSAFPPPREIATHKGNFGHVVIVAGSLGYHGAAVLAARGALRAQPGLVSVFIPPNVYLPVASQLQAAMVHPWKSAQKFPDSCSAILFGPGLAAKTLPANLRREMVKVWQQSPLPVIADASALDWLPAAKKIGRALRVITPHPGEAARLLSSSARAVQADRVASLRKLSARFGSCVVLLKGHQTLVGRGDGEIFINSSGNPFLAQGGSGDVLSGYIAGLLAQPALQTDPLKTIRYAAWQHGAAADFLSETQPGWTIDDLLQVLGRKK